MNNINDFVDKYGDTFVTFDRYSKLDFTYIGHVYLKDTVYTIEIHVGGDFDTVLGFEMSRHDNMKRIETFGADISFYRIFDPSTGEVLESGCFI